jgi:S-adenosylmethionine:tRNA ribosyltransferase-isomerase
LSSGSPVEWKCIIGNLKKWKEGFISISFNKGGFLKAEKLHPIGDTWRVRFTWNDPSLSFAEVIEATGHVPLPPYITRSDEPGDMSTYQTVYSSVRGSVAAPTAGLHFTPEVLERLAKKGIKKEEVTLHVGAGTFQPVKSDLISEHKMHCEHFFVSSETIETLIVNIGRIIPVGTTSVRTIESLYWLGVKLLVRGSASPADFHVGQWEAYENQTDVDIITALNSLLQYMNANNLLFLHVSTSIIIVPGYNFRLTNGIITNFHQPRSTLLLLISAFTGEKWREVYAYALENNFRFLSYGDSSLIIGK